MATGEETAKPSGSDQAASPWAAALSKLREWDPTWAEQAVKITTNPWTDGVLPTKFIELVCVGLNVSRTNLNPEGTRHHIRAAICGRREPSGNLVRSQMRVGHVHSFRQL